jgi:hypothetical protein
MENGEVVLLALRTCDGLGGKGAGKYADLAETSASVVVASKTAESIGHASRLAIVPYGDGELKIRRAGEEMKPAQLIEQRKYPRQEWDAHHPPAGAHRRWLPGGMD